MIRLSSIAGATLIRQIINDGGNNKFLIACILSRDALVLLCLLFSFAHNTSAHTAPNLLYLFNNTYFNNHY